ncbi:unnamed protein product [Trichogramma brassicae]|uniref:CHK kinase-like domain-containing protein n=1 Tax=Trichogramma brassicae TaxID=86971 RepID=A0A6H5IDM5_9HYME|nr:unnamed protein product [Trichogramma brassicae]
MPIRIRGQRSEEGQLVECASRVLLYHIQHRSSCACARAFADALGVKRSSLSSSLSRLSAICHIPLPPPLLLLLRAYDSARTHWLSDVLIICVAVFVLILGEIFAIFVRLKEEELKEILNVKLKVSEPREIINAYISPKHPDHLRGIFDIVYRRRRLRNTAGDGREPEEKCRFGYKIMDTKPSFISPECEFYVKLLPELRRHSGRLLVDDVVLTTYPTMGKILLIDLEQTQPYFTTNSHCWLDLADLQAVVEALARLHSASLMGSHVKVSPKTYLEKYGRAFNEEVFCEYTVSSNRLRYVVHICERVAEWQGLSREDVEIVRYAIVKAFVDVYKWDRVEHELGSVVSHGTTIPGTVYLRPLGENRKRDADGRTVQEEVQWSALLSDCSRLRFGPRTLDFGQFVYSCCSPHTDEILIQGLLLQYWSEQGMCLEREAPEVKQILKEWHQTKLSSIYLAIINTPVIWLGNFNKENKLPFEIQDLMYHCKLHDEFMILLKKPEVAGFARKMKMLVGLLCHEARRTISKKDMQKEDGIYSEYLRLVGDEPCVKPYIPENVMIFDLREVQKQYNGEF